MYANGTERMARRAPRITTAKRGKSSMAGKRTTLERKQARALKMGGAR